MKIAVALALVALAIPTDASATPTRDPDVRKGEVYGTPYSNDTQRKIRREREIARQVERDRQRIAEQRRRARPDRYQDDDDPGCD